MSSSSNLARGGNPNRLIAAEELAGASRFRFDALGQPPAPTNGAPRRGEAPIRAHAETRAPAEALAAALEQRYQAGLLAGHASGYQQGMAEANARIDALRADFSALAVSLHNATRQLEDGVALRVVDLVRALTRQVVRSELAIRPEAVLDVARDCLALVSESVSRIAIHLHPEDFALVGERLAAEDPRITLSRDPAMTRGGCRVVTSQGEIDGGLEHRIARALAALTPMAPDAGT